MTTELDFPGLQQAIIDNLPKLLSGEIEAIEYGDPNLQGGFMSYMRIRCILTPAGRQYAIKTIHLGVESSGQYYPPSEYMGLINRALNLIVHYHRPMGLKLYAPDRAERLHHLCFFPVEKVTLPINPYCEGIGDDAEVVTFSLAQ